MHCKCKFSSKYIWKIVVLSYLTNVSSMWNVVISTQNCKSEGFKKYKSTLPHNKLHNLSIICASMEWVTRWSWILGGRCVQIFNSKSALKNFASKKVTCSLSIAAQRSLSHQEAFFLSATSTWVKSVLQNLSRRRETPDFYWKDWTLLAKCCQAMINVTCTASKSKYH